MAGGDDRRRISTFGTTCCTSGGRSAPTRDAVREIIDGRSSSRGTPFTREVFPKEVERQFATTYDKLLRATEGIELARDLLAGVRDYHQAQIANDQNEVMKRLTAIASILLSRRSSSASTGRTSTHARAALAAGYAFSWA